MSKRRWLLVTLTVTAALSVLFICLNLAGCFSGLPTGQRFEVFEVRDHGTTVTWLPDRTAYLKFEFPKRMSGSGGCNTFTGLVDLDDGRLVTSEMTYTNMGCPDDVIKQDQFLADLVNSRPMMELDDGILVLTADDGRQVRLRQT